MTEKQEIEVEIGEDGNVTFHVVGGSGPSCLDLTKGLEEALGHVVHRKKTSEYYQEEVKLSEKIQHKKG